MAHFHSTATRAERTATEWLPVGAQLGELVNDWAGRSDLVAYVGPGAGGQAPACYNPLLSEIEVNVDVAFGAGIKPELVGDLTKRDTQFDWPKASGAIFHEALHARYSRWDLSQAQRDLGDREFQAINLLEETRIEHIGAITKPENRGFLRACALEIVLADAADSIKELTSTRAAAQLAGLTLARVDAGVLDREDVEPIADLLQDFLGEDVLIKLRSIWNRFQMHDDHYNAKGNLYDLAREWVQAVEDVVKERDEDSGKGEGENQDFIEELLDALDAAATAAAISSQDELADQQTREAWARIVSKRGSAAREKSENSKLSKTVFDKGTGPMPGSKTSSYLREVRKPEPAERAAAVKVAQLLEKAKYRERDAHDISSVTPPGRLRTRAMVQGAALKSKGIMSQTEPWRRTVRKHTDEPSLRIGVMVDISGSMRAAMEPMATTAWVMSEAARRVQAKAAMVYYGNDVFPTLKAGQHLDKVNIFTAPDGTEKFDKAFKALDGALDLLHGDGARLLVIVSDGQYTDVEEARAKHWMKRCHAEGVAVLWLPFDDSRWPARLSKGTDAVVLPGNLNPVAAATAIGQAAASALTKVGQRAA